MEEIELAEIESRIQDYPVQARRDVLRLTAELRHLHGFTAPAKAPGPGSPLYDPVTGLLNGAAYGVRFAAARARATRYQKRFAVMSIDVALSEAEPDSSESHRALKLVSERLEQCVRATDTLARIDHEKFAVILEDLLHDGQAHPVTEKVQRALGEPISVGHKTIYPDARLSIQFYPTTEKAAAQPLDS